jgi:hypothetical protein
VGNRVNEECVKALFAYYDPDSPVHRKEMQNQYIEANFSKKEIKLAYGVCRDKLMNTRYDKATRARITTTPKKNIYSGPESIPSRKRTILDGDLTYRSGIDREEKHAIRVEKGLAGTHENPDYHDYIRKRYAAAIQKDKEDEKAVYVRELRKDFLETDPYTGHKFRYDFDHKGKTLHITKRKK